MWIGIAISFIILVFVLWAISLIEWNINRQYFHGKTGWFPQFWFLFRSLVNRKKIIHTSNWKSFLKKSTPCNLANDVINFTPATRMVIAAWCLMGIVFVNSYTSSLLSYLMAPTFLPVISTVQDLAESHYLHLIILKNTVVDSVLLVIGII